MNCEKHDFILTTKTEWDVNLEIGRLQRIGQPWEDSPTLHCTDCKEEVADPDLIEKLVKRMSFKVTK